MRGTAKTVDVICMDIQRCAEVGEDNSNTSKERTSTTTIDAYSEDESSEAEVQQLLCDLRCFEEEIQAAIHDKEFDGIDEVDQNRESEYGNNARRAAEVQQSSSDP